MDVLAIDEKNRDPGPGSLLPGGGGKPGLGDHGGKFAAVIGPALMGWAAVLTGNPRFGILSIVILFVAGGICLWFVDEQEGIDAVQKLEAG